MRNNTKNNKLAFDPVKRYGINRILRKYVDYPDDKPLTAHYDHAWSAMDGNIKYDIDHAKYLMLVYSKRRKKAWDSESNVPSIIIGDLMVHYRHMNSVKQLPDAKGTIVFPSHSTKYLREVYDINKYAILLSELPRRFHPVTVCLHPDDIKRSYHNNYKLHGLYVTSAARTTRDPNFVTNLYKIIQRHKYATSNRINTSTFLSVEMGLPYFLYGDVGTVIQHRTFDRDMPHKYKMTDNEIGKKCYNIFDYGPTDIITKEQKEFVEYELGINDCEKPSLIKDNMLDIYKKYY